MFRACTCFVGTWTPSGSLNLRRKLQVAQIMPSVLPTTSSGPVVQSTPTPERILTFDMLRLRNLEPGSILV